MTSTRLQNTAIAALLGGLVYAFIGAIQATHEFGGTHNTIDSTAEYLVTGGLGLAIAFTVPAYRALAALAGSARLAVASIAPQLTIASMTTISVINGEDPSFFNAVAPIALLVWLASTITLAVKLRRNRTVTKPVAIAIGLLVPVTFALSPIGGPLLTGAFWLAAATHVLRDGVPASAPVAA